MTASNGRQVGKMITDKRKQGIRSDSGAVTLFVAVMMVALLGVAAIVVDAGAVYAHRRQLQTAADAAALAGVQALPGDPAEAKALAAQYANQNSPDSEELTFEIDSKWVANDTIVAVVRDPDLGLFFARFMGLDETPVNATATAMVGSPRAYGSGVMPFGIIASGTVEPPYGYQAGQEIVLVEDKGSQSQGNWHYVDLLPFSSQNNTKNLISEGGTSETLSIGDIINTQTGAPNNPNYASLVSYFAETCAPHGLNALAYDDDRGVWDATHSADGTPCNRLITCPVIVVVGPDPYAWNSITGSSKVKVVGFLNMLVSNNPNHKDGALYATFVQTVPENALKPGGLLDYAGVITWLEQ